MSQSFCAHNICATVCRDCEMKNLPAREQHNSTIISNGSFCLKNLLFRCCVTRPLAVCDEDDDDVYNNNNINNTAHGHAIPIWKERKIYFIHSHTVANAFVNRMCVGYKMVPLWWPRVWCVCVQSSTWGRESSPFSQWITNENYHVDVLIQRASQTHLNTYVCVWTRCWYVYQIWSYLGTTI